MIQVDVLGAGLVAMSDLQVGDRVASVNSASNVVYEEVYFFGHQSQNAVSEMVSISIISSAGNATLALTSRCAPPPSAIYNILSAW